MKHLFAFAIWIAVWTLLDGVYVYVKRKIKPMGYAIAIDEYSTDALSAELKERSLRLVNGRCDYCNRLIGSKPDCKFPERHNPELGYILKVHSSARMKAVKEVGK